MRDLFGTIAPKYDFITRVFSYGMDRGWKRMAVAGAALPARAAVLDLACGTGDFGKLAAAHCSGAHIVAADLTEPMLRLAEIPDRACADAASLPFRTECFDAVFVGYGLRNFPRLATALEEVRRVLKPGGLLVTLDFFLPARPSLRRLFLAYLYAQGAFWGLVLHRRARVYTYIPDSLRTFLPAEKFSLLLKKTGFADVTARQFLLGGIAVHWARKSPPACVDIQ